MKFGMTPSSTRRALASTLAACAALYAVDFIYSATASMEMIRLIPASLIYRIPKLAADQNTLIGLGKPEFAERYCHAYFVSFAITAFASLTIWVFLWFGADIRPAGPQRRLGGWGVAGIVLFFGSYFFFPYTFSGAKGFSPSQVGVFFVMLEGLIVVLCAAYAGIWVLPTLRLRFARSQVRKAPPAEGRRGRGLS